MKLTRITKENLEYFRMFLPPGQATSEQEALGLITEEGVPCAAALISGADQDVALDWLYVHPDNRRQGAGSELLEKIEDLLRSETDALSVAYPDEIKGLDEFFTANGYLVTNGDAVYSLSLMELQETTESKALKKMADKEEVSMLSSLNPDEKAAFLDYLVENFGPEAHYFRCEPKLSLAAMDQNRQILAALLIATDDVTKTLFLSALASKGRDGAKAVLGRALRILETGGDYGEYSIQFVSGNPSIDSLMETISTRMKEVAVDHIRYGVKSLEE